MCANTCMKIGCIRASTLAQESNLGLTIAEATSAVMDAGLRIHFLASGREGRVQVQRKLNVVDA